MANHDDEPAVEPGWYMHDARASGQGFAGYTGELACAATVYYLSAAAIESTRRMVRADIDRGEYSHDRRQPVTNRAIRDRLRVRVPYPTVASVPLRDLVRLDADLGPAFAALLRAQSATAATQAAEEAERLRLLARKPEEDGVYPWALDAAKGGG